MSNRVIGIRHNTPANDVCVLARILPCYARQRIHFPPGNKADKLKNPSTLLFIKPLAASLFSGK